MLAVCGETSQLACAVGIGTCVTPVEVCDGTQQCFGGTDELNCRKYLLLSMVNCHKYRLLSVLNWIEFCVKYATCVSVRT